MAIVCTQAAVPAACSARPPARPSVQRRKLGPWTLEVTRDAFAASISCRIWAHGMMVDHAAVRFDLGRRTRTFEALYRIDQGPPTSWRVNAMTLASNGVQLASENLENPSNGWVTIPLDAVRTAHEVVIRPSPRAPARTFNLGGLQTALDQASAASCDPDMLAPQPK